MCGGSTHTNRKDKMQQEFLTLYKASLKNASDLLSEAQLLFENHKYARAYALAFTALEEISKSQLAADVFTGLITNAEFDECFRNHRMKIERMAWATDDARRYLAMPEEEYIEVQEPTFGNRIDSMYVGFKNGKVFSPTDAIGEEDARSIIHTTEVAMQRIIEVTEFWGHQIGTKGFMK
jgi:AbiV family abortive infection protein